MDALSQARLRSIPPVGRCSPYCRRHVLWPIVIVHPVVMPGKEALSFALLGDDGSVVEPVETYLAYLAALERSPNTQRAYATSLKLWFEFLDRVDLAWDDVGVDDVARFVSWLRSPADNVIVLDAGTGRRAPATVNRHLSAVFGFYEHHARSGGEGRFRARGMASSGSRRLQAVSASRIEGPADHHAAGEAAGGQANAANVERRGGGHRAGVAHAGA